MSYLQTNYTLLQVIITLLLNFNLPIFNGSHRETYEFERLLQLTKARIALCVVAIDTHRSVIKQQQPKNNWFESEILIAIIRLFAITGKRLQRIAVVSRRYRFRPHYVQRFYYRQMSECRYLRIQCYVLPKNNNCIIFIKIQFSDLKYSSLVY